MRDIARKSNGILDLAQDEAVIRRHAEKGGFPVHRISEVKRMIDPSTALA